MPVKLSGTLVIKVITGRNGQFSVGDLLTPEGEFKVKDSILDQFEEGRYEGDFIVDRFYMSSYVSRGKSTTEIRAQVSDISLSEAIEGEQEASPSEPDPIVTDVQHVQHADSSAIVPAAVLLNDEVQQDTQKDELIEVLGIELAELARNSMPIKLDPLGDRTLFRRQIRLLKERLGYEFISKEQTWHPVTTGAES